MDFWETIKKRHCVRSFAAKQVSDDLIEKIISAGKLAPSAGGLQTWHFEIIKEQKIKDDLTIASMMQKFIAQAPIVIVICADVEKSAGTYGERGRDLYAIQDTAAATQNMLLAVTDLGLGACWVGAFDEDKVSQILNLPSQLRPVVILPVGYKN